MNREAHSLGMHDTHYATPHGLDAPHQYSSAYDLALLGRYATGMQSLMKIVDTRTYLWNGHLLTNVNQVLFWYPGVDGIKPGFTDAAGLCQVLDARRDGRHVIVAILHTPDLVHDARNLLNFGLRDFRWTVSPLGDSPAATEAGTDRRGPYVYYPATGHFLRPPFWNAYQDAGGSLTLGYPRTEPLNEGSTLVQYFQDGALTENLATKRITRLALGASLAHDILPPTPTSTPTATPVEGTIGTPGWPGVSRTPTPAPTSTPLAKPLVARPLQHYIQKHRFAAGPYAGPWHWEHGFQVQIFRYSALAYSWRSRTVYVLPVGDRYLAGRTMLPAHPGNSYPSDFAPPSVLAQLGW
ncbi:MAG: D-alanyl-D-alanine carboxypeptidase family protein, partial [Trebonia sp.]